MIRLTRDQVRRIDRLAAERYHIPGIVLMENAARAVADRTMEILATAGGHRVLIVCGGGNNGGDSLAAARHLHNRGANVTILLTADPAKYENEARANWEIVQAMKLPAKPADPTSLAAGRSTIILDAIFGTGLTQPPRPPFAEIADAMQAVGVPILAVDIPSGLDCDTGRPLGTACIAATHTVTFIAEKVGFASAEACRWLGEVTVADIGCPIELIATVQEQPPGQA